MHIDLDIITDEHLFGKWEVAHRIINEDSKKHPFFNVKSFEISKGSFIALNGKKLTGKLDMVGESEIIYNPQLKFYKRSEEIGNAIITRLFMETAEETYSNRMTLYFSTGLELVLHKNYKNG